MNIRINAGGGAYTDSAGNQWQADTFFSGGNLFSTTAPIGGTDLDPIYQSERYGNFAYAIPVNNGTYDITLLLAEIYWPNSNQRIFDVTVEGQLVENNLDIFALAGSNNAYQVTLKNIAVSDGVLDLGFITEVDNAKLSGLQVLSAATPAPFAIRINAGGGAYTDSAGNQWIADQYFTTGTTYSSFVPIAKTEDDPIYQTERFANDLEYKIPVANGNYLVKLHFAEIYWDNFNQRVFDVSIEGTKVYDNVDIFARSQNAFFSGKDSALILSDPAVTVTDGELDLSLLAKIDNAKLSGIEIIPLTGPQVFFNQTDNDTTVKEGGLTDLYTVVLNTQPTDNVTINVVTDSQLNVNNSALTFTPANWNIPQTVTVTAVDDTIQQGTHFSTITHTISSTDPNYNGKTLASVAVTILDNDVVPIVFNQKTIATNIDPTSGFGGATRGVWGPDGRLYVSTYSGVIKALTLDDNYNVTAVQTIGAIAGLSNHNILGLAFNPFDNNGSGQPKLYVAHSQLYANGGASFPDTELSPYSGQVSVLEGPNFSTITPLITGLPVSNHDHGINGLTFDNQGSLYIEVGSNTNAGITNSAIGGLPESPLTNAILKADITKPGFNGAITYNLPSDFVPPKGLTFDPKLSQVFGDVAKVASGVDVSVYASGLRNSFGMVFDTNGNLYATDNGANAGFGDKSTSATTQQPFNETDFDTLNLIVQGAYYGSPNRNRGSDPGESRQNVFYSSEAPTIAGVYTAPIAKMDASTNGIDEYRATTFGGQLRGDLFAQKWNGQVYGFKLSADGQQVVNTENYNFANGLDLLAAPGGAFVSIDLSQNSVKVAIPDDATPGMNAFDIFPWRAPAVGGSQFIIGGEEFNPANTTVTIGGQTATLTSVSSNRIQGIFPSLTPDPIDGLVDLVVQSGGQFSTIANAFLPLV